VPDRYLEPYRYQRPAIASFFAMIANIDDNMRQLDAFLRETGLQENTILIFMTDNGTATGDPVFNAGMRGKKIALYEGGHRVPFFIRWPAGKLRAAGDVDALAQVQDVLPTLLDLCAVPKPAAAKFDGTSLAPLLRGQVDAPSDRMMVIQFTRMDDSHPRRGEGAVLWKRWRLINDQELFDLATDPAQARNVIARHPEVAAKMREHYARWWAGVEPRVNDISPVHVGSPEYEISLRRWPEEADAAITAPMPAYKGVDGTYPAGEALPIARAELRIGDWREAKPIAADDKVVSFRLGLKRGRTELQTWFRDAGGQEICGAYYVSVRAL
jgi:hypothetical protein